MSMNRLIAVMLALAPASGLAKGASGGGVDVSGAYIYDAHAYANGRGAEQSFHYHGSRATASLHVPLQYGKAKGTCGLYAQEQVLKNYFEEEVASGTAKGTETLTATGGGVHGVLVSDWTGNLQVNLSLGISRAEIVQTGDTPKTQIYPFSAEGKLGIGAGPMLGASGFFVRAEYQMMGLWNGKTVGSDEKIRNVIVENWAPAAGYMLSF